MNETAQKSSFLQALQDWYQSQQIPSVMDDSKHQLVELGFFLAIGFLSGFLFKKYGHLFFLLFLFTLGLLLLEQFQIIDIVPNWDVIEQTMGLKKAVVAREGAPYFLEWVRLNIWVVISFTIGVIFGFKVG